jgi:hypothetical protein
MDQPVSAAVQADSSLTAKDSNHGKFCNMFMVILVCVVEQSAR